MCVEATVQTQIHSQELFTLSFETGFQSEDLRLTH